MITLGISTCPNDVFIFAALLYGKIDSDIRFDVLMEDVQELNSRALIGDLDMVKVSYGVLNSILDTYKLLPAGGAMGYGVGPLVLTKEDMKNPCNIAVPGKNTTALKVFSICFPELYNKLKDNIHYVRFDKIMPAIRSGEFDMGIVIHEGRFTYKNYGLKQFADIGNVWHEKFSSPLPLGGIALKNDKAAYASKLNSLILKSMDYAYQNLDELMPFIREHADEMEPDVMKAHINLYVNAYSKDARTGIDGIKQLLGTDDIFHNV